ncbi:hypothetical protein SEA_FIZZLES_26 [Microbacterium phage Fizzles]|nr:hypothetical protein SEA_FIZZLES_26 [Microbacterium phage Fizzles]
MAGAVLPIDAPTRAPRLGGIESVAEFRSNSRVGIGTEVTYQAEGCEFPQTEVLRCFTDATVPDKTFSGIGIEDAISEPFTIFAGVQCFVNSDQADFARRAREQLAAGRGRVLEEVLGAWGDGGTALDAGGSVVNAIALVDQELDDKYIGRGVIMMSRFDAVLADAGGALSSEDGVLQTINGTPVFASGRITPGTVYGFGSIVVEHSPTSEYQATQHETNKHFALAEEQVVLAVDCEFRVHSATTADNG